MLIRALCRRTAIGGTARETAHRILGIVRMASDQQKGAASLQPAWLRPESTDVPRLTLYNSLTRSKEEFVPLQGRRVLWYSCGPTVYDASHMGHARSYITFDLLRRVLSDYFGYDVLYVMNITDIDDKIIHRARRNHLMEKYIGEERTLSELTEDIKQALQPWKQKAEKEGDEAKKTMLNNTTVRVEKALQAAIVGSEVTPTQLLLAAHDPLSAWLDAKFGAEIRDLGIFAGLTRRWEEEFHGDMEALHVLPPDVLTRVSEYVPEIVEFIRKIMENGYGYESNGSVYFDVVKFSTSPAHSYAKLVPEAVGDLQALAEGEGDWSEAMEKRSAKDFALWKASKPGEPSWPSPWGHGRPGWHIECSVMACDILGERADIHTGGVDLKFPHHDNEIAQAEACYGYDQWVNYFLHSGHLTIEGCKMAKSLKNFITIKDALQRYSARQLRLMFLLHAWNATLDYSESTMSEALGLEKIFNEFFLTVKDRVHRQPSGVDAWVKFTGREKQLMAKFVDTKTAIHKALCDSVDTPTVMQLMRELVSVSNIYLTDGGPTTNTKLLQGIAQYLTHLLKVFGVIPGDQNALGFPLRQQTDTDQERVIMPYLTVMADFREKIRRIALEDKSVAILQECDVLRDETLVELGVRLEDREQSCVVKLVGKDAILEERERDRKLQEERRRQKEEQKRKMEEARRQREAQAAVPPQAMFLGQTDKYSRFDEQGLPTHDVEGECLSEKQRKKLRKLWDAQDKKHREHLTRTGGTS